MIRVLEPVWLLLALPLVPLLLRGTAGRPLARGLRAAVFACVLVALARPVVRMRGREGVIVAVVDRSASMPDDARRNQEAWLARLQETMPARSRFGVVAFAERSAIEQAPQHGAFGGFLADLDGDASDLASAIDTALSLIPREAAARLLVLSDGLYTGRNPQDAATAALTRGIPIDYRFQPRTGGGDVAIASFEAPAEPRPGERIVLTAWVHAPRPMSLPFRLERDGRTLAEGERLVPAGRSPMVFADMAPPSGVVGYRLTLPAAADDPVPENNRAQALLRVASERTLLCLTPGPDSGLAGLLRRGGLSVDARRAEAFDGSLAALSAYGGVLIENVPADALGRPALAGLAAWVHEFGGGLMMTGGRRAFGAGGYFGSPLDPLLPVSLEARREHRKLSLAVVIVLDRSGSMAMPAGPGRSKMDLANLGCIQVLDLLAEDDAIGVLAVDTAVHTIVPLLPVEEAQAQRDRILGIRSQGGGIFTYTGLRAAASMLLDRPAGARHIILFADAADAEEPGGYIDLLARCREAGITCSVVGLGSPQDRDADFLRDVADRGGGAIYFTDRAEEIPRIFAQDTLTVTRQTFLDEPAALRVLPGMGLLSAVPFPDPPAVGGFNLCYLRPGATAALVTDEEDPMPILSFWQSGAGRVLCFAAEADGAYAGAFAGWARAGDFHATLARWTLGAEETPGMAVRHRIRDDALRVELHLDPGDETAVSGADPELVALHERPGEPPARAVYPFRWTAPDRLEAEAPLRGADTLLTAVRVAGRAPIPLPPVRLPYSPEFRPRDPTEGRTALRQLAQATGGIERMDLAGAWRTLRTGRSPREAAPFFALLAAFFLLADVFERRTGLLSAPRGRFAPAGDRPAAAQGSTVAPATTDRPAPPTSPAPAPEPAESPSAGALQTARRRARQRLGRE